MEQMALRQLGNEARAFLQERLKIGGSLAHCILDSIDLTRGSVFTYLPTSVSHEQAVDFETGGKLELRDEDIVLSDIVDGEELVSISRRRSTTDWLAGLINKWLRSEPNRGCIIENPVFRKSDPCISAETHPTIFVGEEVYYTITPDTDRKSIEDALNKGNAMWYSLATAFTQPEGNTTFGDRQTIDARNMEAVARNSIMLATCTYDGESYAVWSRLLQVEDG